MYTEVIQNTFLHSNLVQSNEWPALPIFSVGYFWGSLFLGRLPDAKFIQNFKTKLIIMKKTHLLMTVLSLALLLMFSCNNEQDVKPSNQSKGDPIPKNSVTGRVAAACGGYASGTYSGVGYHTYPATTIDASSISATGHISIFCTAYDVPNRFTVKDSGGNTVAYTGWLGYATYGGPWGSSINNIGSASLYFTRGSSTTFTLTVETSPPSNQNDAWEASIGCSN
jgi:hypothetical protein